MQLRSGEMVRRFQVCATQLRLEPVRVLQIFVLKLLDGTPRSSAVAYDKPSAGRRKQGLEAAGCSDVQIVETMPGQLPEAVA